MRVVLDSNEYILALGERRKNQMMLFRLLSGKDIFLPHLVLEEVLRNLKYTTKDAENRIRREMESRLNVVDDSGVPSVLVEKYRNRGMKSADALIAAFTEWINADILISENRHFLTEIEIDEFEVVTAEQFLKAFLE